MKGTLHSLGLQKLNVTIRCSLMSYIGHSFSGRVVPLFRDTYSKHILSPVNGVNGQWNETIYPYIFNKDFCLKFPEDY